MILGVHQVISPSIVVDSDVFTHVLVRLYGLIYQTCTQELHLRLFYFIILFYFIKPVIDMYYLLKRTSLNVNFCSETVSNTLDNKFVSYWH